MTPYKLPSIDGVTLDAMTHEPEGSATNGTVIQAHGITVDMDEGGMYVRLAERLAAEGFAVLRFSFRGHGRSGGTQQGTTIAGEMLDLQAAVETALARYPGALSVVAASFGSVPVCASLPYLRDDLRSLVLWNPVFDLNHTFTDPKLPWGQENFGPGQQALLHSQGYLCIDGTFRMGRVLFEETRHYNPLSYFLASRVPALIVHGDQDTAVSYDIATDAADKRSDCAFHTVAGSDHGFDSREREDEAIAVTVDWLRRRDSQ